ncbi:MAG: hypothetical protein ACTS9Y_00205 [Methylophilus sp.]|uniref:hypothetical protein n=1 Tax=Methylophilus sp. TaxID=29541 RepID=UPI003F9F8430
MKNPKYVSDIDYEVKMGQLSQIEASLIADGRSFLGPRLSIASRVGILTYFFSLCFFACVGFMGIHVAQSLIVMVSTCMCISALVMCLVLSNSAWTYSAEIQTKIESYKPIDAWQFNTFKGLAKPDGSYMKPHVFRWIEIERIALVRCIT